MDDGVTEGAGRALSAFPAAGRVLRECEQIADVGDARLAPLAADLRAARERLGQPMRLAVVGQIKRGKSTLVNALLGEEVAFTGQLELTFTVNEFRYGDDRSVFVINKDGTSRGPLPPSALEGLTVRDPARADQLRKIRKVEFTMSNPLLRTFRLVDTPGLGSVHGADAENTTEFLGISSAFGSGPGSGTASAVNGDAQVGATLAAMGRSARDVHDDSVREIDGADAVLYLFSRALHEGDYGAVADFLGPVHGSVTPLRAFAVLSRCDQYWPPDRDLPDHPDPLTYDPMAAAARIAEGYLARPDIRRLFFTVVPVAGLVGIGAQALTQDELGWLQDLAKVEPPVLMRRLRDAGRFATAAELAGIALPAELRRQLVKRLSVWGIHLACCYLRAGLGEAEVRDRLITASGVARLRELITGHFGNRSSIIKFDHGIRDITAAVARLRLGVQRSGGEVPETVSVIAGQIEQLRVSEHGSHELAALSGYYSGKLSLAATEIADLLTVTGENGTTCAARLGLPETASVAELAATAAQRVAKWARREQDPTLDRATLRAAHTIRLSYDRIAHRVGQARRLLEMTDDPMAGW
jgi:Dynamin family